MAKLYSGSACNQGERGDFLWTNRASGVHGSIMKCLVIACMAAMSAAGFGADPAWTADGLKQALNDPESDVSRMAKGAIGPGGGNQFFYFPTHDEPATPATWGFRFETIGFRSADGTRLHGWFIPSRERSARGTVVFSHGNAGSLGHHLGFVMWLVEAGYHVMMYDYRGFGKSAGRVDRAGMVRDVSAAFEYTATRGDVDATRLVSYGHSLGGAKSLAAIGGRPVRGLRAVVVDGAFASYRAMARRIGGQLAESLVTDDLAPKDYVSKLGDVPLLVVHGTKDEIVPVSQGRELYQKAGGPKTLFEVKSGHHGDSLARDGGLFRKRMLEWLALRMPR